MSEYRRSLPTRLDSPSASENKPTIVGTTPVAIKFNQDIIAIQIVNHSETAIIYININGVDADVTKDIPIYSRSGYSADRIILKDTGISLISSEANADVRIVGHYTLVAEG